MLIQVQHSRRYVTDAKAGFTIVEESMTDLTILQSHWSKKEYQS
jgi:hypothetical protein